MMTSTTSSSAVTTASEVAVKLCFNTYCNKPLEKPRRGWRCRTGDFAQLCDRCCSAYEESKFCESFHLNASGWRCCETCGKQIHCGCIVSFHLFVLLDAGGIECIKCTRKSFILTPNPAWPPPSFLPLQSEINNNHSLKDWSPIAGLGPVPWRQAPSLFNGFSTKRTLQAKPPLEIDLFGGSDNARLSDGLSAASHERKKKEDSRDIILVNGSLKPCVSEVFENGDNGFKCHDQTNAVTSSPQKAFFPDDISTRNVNLTKDSPSKTELISHANTSTTIIRPPVLSLLVGKQSCTHNEVDTSGETQPRNEKARVDGRSRNHLLPRDWPPLTDQELQQISGNTNSVITPLFEKILSASDAGRIGRLVLPKKCAEAYLPPIYHSEGLPLQMKDVKGNEWVFQFRFWPNNNSRMYVLEGVTPCIQALQLQAGDIVTFSRIEPEGKFVMGGRKVSTAQSDQGNEGVTNGDGVSVNWDICTKSDKNEATSTSLEAKEIHVKRKNSTLASKTKRLRIENKEMIELEVNWKEIQRIIRPPPNYLPRVMAIEDYEIEEYEGHEPIIGRPTIPATDDYGGKIQWVQCEDCFKWRKLPANILLPSRWTCSLNVWDQERSVCSAAQECTTEHLEALLPTDSKAAKKKRTAKHNPESVAILLEGLDIKEEGPSSLATTRHPRHKLGCACIVCMQPPSGCGKHKKPCECIVCQSVKRRLKRMMMKRQERQQQLLGGKDAGTIPFQNLHPDVDTNLSFELGTCPNQYVAVEGFLDESNGIEFSASPLKARIDLNQPEREEESNPGTISTSILPFLHK